MWTCSYNNSFLGAVCSYIFMNSISDDIFFVGCSKFACGELQQKTEMFGMQTDSKIKQRCRKFTFMLSCILIFCFFSGSHPDVLRQTRDFTAGPVRSGINTLTNSLQTPIPRHRGKLHMKTLFLKVTCDVCLFQSDSQVSIVLPTIHEVDLFR